MAGEIIVANGVILGNEPRTTPVSARVEYRQPKLSEYW